MTFRARLLRFTKKILRVGKSGDTFFGGRPVSPANTVDAARSEHEGHSRSLPGMGG